MSLCVPVCVCVFICEGAYYSYSSIILISRLLRITFYAFWERPSLIPSGWLAHSLTHSFTLSPLSIFLVHSLLNIVSAGFDRANTQNTLSIVECVLSYSYLYIYTSDWEKWNRNPALIHVHTYITSYKWRVRSWAYRAHTSFVRNIVYWRERDKKKSKK